MPKGLNGRAFHAVALLAALALSGCVGGGRMFEPISETTKHGYVIPDQALEQISPGSSQDQVLIVLGTPSTTANFSGEVYYYIGQTRHRSVAFMPSKVVDQRVLAVYFDKNHKVERVANYGKKDGKVFDFVSRTTPTGGRDESFLQQVLSGVVGMNPGLGH
jgi:outer membrane protein assembly factor BamE (lipoprotein component of BamABCDE complex)